MFVCYTISLSSLCKLIWRHWTYKMPVRYILSSVWVRLSIFSELSIIQYMGLCVFSVPISLVMIERIILCLVIHYYLFYWFPHPSKHRCRHKYCVSAISSSWDITFYCIKFAFVAILVAILNSEVCTSGIPGDFWYVICGHILDLFWKN